MNTTEITVARVNQVDITIIQNGEKRVAVRPICDALGINYQGQIERLKLDPIIGSTVTLGVTVGADGKEREMVTIPLHFVFGWLFRIDSRNVKPEAKEAVEKYQLECYMALYNYFTRHDEFLEFRDRAVAKKLAILDAARLEFRNAKENVTKAREQLNAIHKISENDYYANKNQLEIEFVTSGEEVTNE